MSNPKSPRSKLTASPPPSIKKHGSTPSVIELILQKTQMEETPEYGLGLSNPYRCDPRYQSYIPRHLTTPSSLQGSPRATGACGLPRSFSMPVLPSKSGDCTTGSGSGSAANANANANANVDVGVDVDADADAGADVDADAPWQCKNCFTLDHGQLQRGSDSSLSCGLCGIVTESVQMIGQERSKNCPRSEDKTQVADGPIQSAQHAAFAAFAHGPESVADRRRRFLVSSGGTRMPTKNLAKNDLLLGQNRIDIQAAKNMKDTLEEDSKDHGKRRGIIRVLEAVFDQLPNLDDRIKKHIRLESIRIYSLSMGHENNCKEKGCLLALSLRSNTVLAYTITECVLEELCSNDENPKTATITSLAPECTRLELSKQLAHVKQLQIRYWGAVQRLQISSAINIIAVWEPGDGLAKCGMLEPSAPPMLRHPPDVANSMYVGGRSSIKDPGERVTKLRDRLIALAQLVNARGDVRNGAVYALGVQSTVDFLEKQDYPIDILATAMLRVTAEKLEFHLEPRFYAIADKLRRAQNISETTEYEFYKTLRGVVILIEPGVDNADFLPDLR